MPTRQPSDAIDFNLHDFVGVRLMDATPADAAAVERQLGPIRSPLRGEPDIVCRFVDQLPTTGQLRYLGLNEAGFTDDAYLVLRTRHKARARIQVPLGSIGGPCEIVCEHGVSAVPLLIGIINLTALRKGYVPIHASAALYRGRGVLVAGWAKGGKTELLLGMMADGARYIGDEWIFLAPDGTEMYGIPEPIKLWASHLAAMPAYGGKIPGGDRVRLAALGAGSRAARDGANLARRTAPGKLLGRLAPALEAQAAVHVTPHRLFGAERCDLRGPLDVIVLALSTESDVVAAEDADAADVARRMTFSVQHERLDLLAHYLRYRFAFPEARNAVIEGAEQQQDELLARALSGRRAFALTHPYPAPIPRMLEALRECLP